MTLFTTFAIILGIISILLSVFSKVNKIYVKKLIDIESEVNRMTLENEKYKKEMLDIISDKLDSNIQILFKNEKGKNITIESKDFDDKYKVKEIEELISKLEKINAGNETK